VIFFFLGAAHTYRTPHLTARWCSYAFFTHYRTHTVPALCGALHTVPYWTTTPQPPTDAPDTHTPLIYTLPRFPACHYHTPHLDFRRLFTHYLRTVDLRTSCGAHPLPHTGVILPPFTPYWQLRRHTRDAQHTAGLAFSDVYRRLPLPRILLGFTFAAFRSPHTRGPTTTRRTGCLHDAERGYNRRRLPAAHTLTCRTYACSRRCYGPAGPVPVLPTTAHGPSPDGSYRLDRWMRTGRDAHPPFRWTNCGLCSAAHRIFYHVDSWLD